MWLHLVIQFFCLLCRRGEISEQIYNFINGEFVPPEDGRFADTLNPSTGEALCKYPLSGVMDLEKAVEAASSAFKLWSKVSKVTEEAEGRLQTRTPKMYLLSMDGM